MKSRLLLGLLLGAASSGCGAPSTGLLRLRSPVAQPVAKATLVTIDDRYIGKLSDFLRRPIRLPVGQHRVTIEEVDHFPYDALIDVAEDGTIELNVQLKPIPD